VLSRLITSRASRSTFDLVDTSRHLPPKCVPEPQIERSKHKDDADVCHQPRPEVMPEEQDIHAHHDGDQSKHVKRDGRVSSHRFILGAGGSAERVNTGPAR